MNTAPWNLIGWAVLAILVIGAILAVVGFILIERQRHAMSRRMEERRVRFDAHWDSLGLPRPGRMTPPPRDPAAPPPPRPVR